MLDLRGYILMRWWCVDVIDGDGVDGDGVDGVEKYTTKRPFCLTILKKFDTLISELLNNMKGEKL